jgi:ribonucleoside-diphosphate reductase alpha chain
LQTKTYWTEHNPSVTITYNDDEVIGLIKWVSEHRELVGGMSFLPSIDAKYAQMPYQEITEKEYEELAEKFPNIDFSKLYRYEEEDYTKAAQELACVSGACDIDGLTTEKIERLDSISGLSSKQPNGNGD